MLDVLAEAGFPLDNKDAAGFTPIYYAAATQTSPVLLNPFKHLGVTLKRPPLPRTATMAPKEDEFPVCPDIEQDSQETLKLANTAKEEEPIK